MNITPLGLLDSTYVYKALQSFATWLPIFWPVDMEKVVIKVIKLAWEGVYLLYFLHLLEKFQCSTCSDIWLVQGQT